MANVFQSSRSLTVIKMPAEEANSVGEVPLSPVFTRPSPPSLLFPSQYFKIPQVLHEKKKISRIMDEEKQK